MKARGTASGCLIGIGPMARPSWVLMADKTAMAVTPEEVPVIISQIGRDKLKRRKLGNRQ